MVDWDDWQNMRPIRSYWSNNQCFYQSGGFWGMPADSSGFARNKDVYTPSGTCVDDDDEGPGTVTYCSWNRKAGGAGAVAELQVRLQRAGYSLTAAGVFGSITKSRVEAFQAARGNLTVDGRVGQNTWNALRDYR